jgi:O-antigen/teichoic acid export membrane protein
MEIALILDLCIAMVQIGGLFLLAGSGLLSAMSAYCAIGFACGFAGTSWLILNRSSFKIQIRQAISDLAHNWTFGKWVFASGILWAISMNLYPWFLTFFHGTASAGVWGACLGVTALANVPLAGMQNYLGPKIANVYADKGIHALRRFVFKGGALLSVVMIILSCVLLIFGEPLIELFYGQKYSGNGFVVFVLALGLVAASTAFSFSRALFAVERADIDFKVNFIPLFILFTIGLWLVYLYGPLGAAVGLLLSNAAASAARCGVFVALSRSMKWNSIGISY